MVTYIGKSTYVLYQYMFQLVPRVRPPDEPIMFPPLQNLNNVSISMITGLETVYYCKLINKSLKLT